MTSKYDKHDSNYREWKKSTGIHKGAREQWDALTCVRSAYEDAKAARESNCYWAGDANQGSGGQTTKFTSGNWEDRWELQEKAAIDFFVPIGSDGFQANVKSPMISGRIQATLHKLKQLNIRWAVDPIGKDDKGKSKLIARLMDSVFTKANIKESMNTIYNDACVHGTAPFRVYYQKKIKNVSLPETSDTEVLSRKKEDLEKGKTVWGKPQPKVAYEDIVIEPVPIRELYVDPQARCLHGESYEARYVVRRRLIHIDDFKAMFEHDPNAMNIDKVKPGSHYYDTEAGSFFQAPKDIANSDYVELLEYENQLDDKYIVVANEFVIKDIPLPYFHKEITYHKIDCIEMPHQFYGIGIPDRLLNIQGTEEVLLNMMIDKVNESMNNMTMIASSAYGQTTRNALRANSSFVPVDITNIGSIANAVYPMPYNAIGFDAYQIIDKLNRMGTQATQMDPNQMGMLTSNTTATLGMINKQQAEALIESIADNFAVGGLLTAGKQMYSIMKQKYSIPKVKELSETKEKEYRTIRLEGEKIVVDPDTEELSFEPSEKQYEFFETKPEYFPVEEDLDIRISPQSLEVMSRALEMQKAELAFTQMMAYAVDPSDTQRAMMNPLPLFDANKIAAWYVETHNLPDDLLLKSDDMMNRILEEAVLESQRMVLGSKVPGIAGRPQKHIDFHVTVLDTIIDQRETMEEQAAELMAQIPAQIDPMTGTEIPPSPPPALLKELDRLTKIEELLAKHIEADATPIGMSDERVLSRMTPPMPQDMGMGMGMPMQQPMNGDPAAMGMMNEAAPMMGDPASMMSSDIPNNLPMI